MLSDTQMDHNETLKDWLAACLQNNPADRTPEQILEMIEVLESTNSKMHSAILAYAPPRWIIDICRNDPKGMGMEFLNSFNRQRLSIHNEQMRYELPNYGGFIEMPTQASPQHHTPPPLDNGKVLTDY